jgi:hypothetical protein
MAISASVPMSSSSELTSHCVNHIFHLFIGDEAVEGALAQHLFDFFYLVSNCACLGMLSAEATCLFKAVFGLGAEYIDCEVFTVMIVSFVYIGLLGSFNIPLFVLR